MSEFWIARGIPGSGKITWAREKLKEFGAPGGMIVERDMIREEFGYVPAGKKGVGTNDEENRVTKIQHERIRQGLRMGLSVIVSDTGLRDKVVRELIGIAEDEGAEVHVKDFRNVPLDVCKERNNLRGEGKVPDHVMDNMYQKFVKGRDLSVIPEAFKLKKAEFDFESVEKYVAPEDGIPTILWDIDGTLASHEGVRSPYDTSKYLEDNPHEDVVSLKRLLDTEYRAVIFSGRHVDHKDVLVEWLEKHGIYWDDIIMRERPSVSDDEEKLMLFEKYVRNDPDTKVVGVFDDRNRVVNNTWRTALGIRCYQVAPGDF